MGSIASDLSYPGLVRRGSAIRNAGLIENIDVLADNTICVRTVEGVVRYFETALRIVPGFIIQSVTPLVSHYGATPHLVLVLHGFTAGQNDQRRITISTDYPVVE